MSKKFKTKNPKNSKVASYKVKLSNKSDLQKQMTYLISTPIKETLAERWWPIEIRQKLNLDVVTKIFIQDPYVAEKHPELGIQEIRLNWESGLLDGPTSSRIAVVDYDGDNDILFEPAKWDRNKWSFVGLDGQTLNISVQKENVKKQISKVKENFQFHQVNVWAVISKVLEFYQNENALGRNVPWGFDGNRLIVVPHAGYGQNAFYDRRSKSLQFYYFISKKERVFTCLSHDIIAHETGHAILDGIRPYYNEINSYQTPAFHEFIADLTAILVSMRNNDVRRALEKATEGDLTKDQFVGNIAEEFGKHVEDREFLRSAINDKKMDDDVNEKQYPHDNSLVLTGAMFDIMRLMGANYMEIRNKTPRQSLWYMINRFTRVALQPLDLCPPVDIQFEDYVNAMLRCDIITNPVDPYGYRAIMRKIFDERKISHDVGEKEPDYSDFFCNNIDEVSTSHMQAYNYIHGKRKKLFIPEEQDIIVLNPYHTSKVRRLHERRPTEIVVQYIWREDVELLGRKFEQLEGKRIPMLCGGTLVFDDKGNLLYQCRKPGTHFKIREKNKGDKAKEESELLSGNRRKEMLLKTIISMVERGEIGLLENGEKSGINIWSPVEGQEVASGIKLEMTPRLHYSKR